MPTACMTVITFMLHMYSCSMRAWQTYGGPEVDRSTGALFDDENQGEPSKRITLLLNILYNAIVSTLPAFLSGAAIVGERGTRSRSIGSGLRSFG